MRRGGAVAEKLGIQNERKPGERMPIGLFAGGEGPFNVWPSQAAQDVRIGGKIGGVVVIYEIEISDGKIDGEYRYGQQETNQRRPKANRRCGWRRVHKELYPPEGVKIATIGDNNLQLATIGWLN